MKLLIIALIAIILTLLTSKSNATKMVAVTNSPTVERLYPVYIARIYSLRRTNYNGADIKVIYMPFDGGYHKSFVSQVLKENNIHFRNIVNSRIENNRSWVMVSTPGEVLSILGEDDEAIGYIPEFMVDNMPKYVKVLSLNFDDYKWQPNVADDYDAQAETDVLCVPKELQ